jgi:hypothetical protein
MARSKCSNQRPDTLMQDRSPPARRNHLQRAAGPYIGSKAPFWQSAGHFRSAPISGHSQGASACLKGAKRRHRACLFDHLVGEGKCRMRSATQVLARCSTYFGADRPIPGSSLTVSLIGIARAFAFSCPRSASGMEPVLTPKTASAQNPWSPLEKRILGDGG